MTKNTNFSLQETLNISVITQTDLAKHIQTTPLANTHEHLASEDEWVHNGPDVLADLFAMYIGNDLLSAGAPYANVERLLDAKDPDISRRWAGVKNAWEHCEYTGYGRAVSYIAKLIYGIDEITTSAVITAQSRITALQQPGQRLHLLKEVANLDHVQIDNFVRACKPDPSGLEFFLYDISWVDFVIGKIEFEELFNEFDIEITDLKSLRAVMAATFTRYAPCAIAVKSQHAYNRTIFWQEREDADAEQVLQKLLSGTELSQLDKLCLGDWCLAQGVELAIKYQLPFKIHTGYLAGNDYYTQPLRTHPAGLAPLLARYPEANFVLMHIAYPYSDDIIALAKHFPNAYIDMCWSWSINPYHAADFVRRFLHAVPRNKLFVFGGDNIWPTGSVAYAAQTRHWLTYALQGEIDDGLMTETETINMATRLMIQNQAEFFDLISTRSAIQATFSGS